MVAAGSLPELGTEDDDDFEDQSLDIDVNVTDSAAGNASWYYQAAKEAKAKEAKTVEVSAEWIKSAAKRAAKKSEAKGVAPPRIFVARKPHW